MNVIWMLWLGRIFNLILYAGLISLAIKKTPVLKMPMLAVACIPISIYQAASLSIDSIIIGLASGLIGVGVAVLITLPMTEIMRHSMEGAENVRAYLSPVNALILIGLSMLVTFIGGIIPAKRAAGKDPVTALRSE